MQVQASNFHTPGHAEKASGGNTYLAPLQSSIHFSRTLARTFACAPPSPLTAGSE
jgi:hypothetical protein